MKRVVAATIMTGGLLMTAASPAAGQAPDRFRLAGNFEYLSSVSNECVPDGGVEICTYVSLSAADTPDGQDFLNLYVSRYERDAEGNYIRHLGDGYGWGEGDVSVTNKLVATLPPTTLQLHTCDEFGCDSRQVVVSARDSAVGEPITERSSHTFKDGDCTYTNRVRSTSGPVAGTITLDGVTYAESGWAQSGTVKVSSSCR